MAGLIPKHFIDDLIGRTDIVEVINARVPLKKQGREFSACCPFHNEKSPSFTVSPDKQFYHCFGCGAHGTAISFLMEFERLDFVEAIEALADLAGIEVEREGAQTVTPQDNLQPLYEVLAQASQFFQTQLRSSQQAKAYLQKRGVNGELARDYQIGFAPAGWDGLLKTLTPKFSQKTLLDAGLLSKNNSERVYDKFRERIMFPIRDPRGRTIAFGGRILETGEPKYLNSPETPVFHKGATLYGLYEARQHAGKLEHIIVVEGYMDVIALAQFGIRNAVATLGTATTPDHLQRLFRLVPRVVFCFDGDRAGKEAGWRALTHGLNAIRDGQRIDFLFLPEGEDPDTLLRHQGVDAFHQLLGDASPLSQFLLTELRTRHDISTMEGRAEMGQAAQQLLKGMQEGLLKQQIVDSIAEITRVRKEKLAPTVFLADTRQRPPIRPSHAESRQQTVRVTSMRVAISALVQQPMLAKMVSSQQAVMLSSLPGGELLNELIDMLHEEPSLSSAMLLERFRGHPAEKHISELSAWTPPVAENNDWARALTDAIESLEKRYREVRLNELLSKGSLELHEKEELRRLTTIRN